jgi:hypothetical protein
LQYTIIDQNKVPNYKLELSAGLPGKKRRLISYVKEDEEALIENHISPEAIIKNE